MLNTIHRYQKDAFKPNTFETIDLDEKSILIGRERGWVCAKRSANFWSVVGARVVKFTGA